MQNLTNKQLKFFNYFLDFWVKYKRQPSYGEMARQYYLNRNYVAMYRMMKRIYEREWLIRVENHYEPNPQVISNRLQKTEN